MPWYFLFTRFSVYYHTTMTLASDSFRQMLLSTNCQIQCRACDVNITMMIKLVECVDIGYIFVKFSDRYVIVCLSMYQFYSWLVWLKCLKQLSQWRIVSWIPRIGELIQVAGWGLGSNFHGVVRFKLVSRYYLLLMRQWSDTILINANDILSFCVHR